MKKNYLFTLSFTLLLLITSFFANAQESPENQKLLSQEPNFLKYHLKVTDSLFIQDIAVLKKFVKLDSIDLEILKPKILYSLLFDSSVDTVVTYKTLVNTVQTFKQGIGYLEFRKSVLLYMQMATVKVNPKNWENDQILFRKLGFTEADLEDFLLFISKPAHKNFNYREAYFAYIKEIDSLQ